MPPFKDESVIIISPGSQYTLAQLGLPESFTPPAWRFPTRMFPGANPGQWEPTKVRPKPPTVSKAHPTSDVGNGAVVNGDQALEVEMQDAPKAEPKAIEGAADVAPSPDAAVTYEEDPMSTEGAVYPLKDGEIENWPCFLALLTHISDTLSPPFHTPIIVISQPCWSARDRELVTQFFFESFKIPAFCLMDAALAACYAYGVSTATVVDVGCGKCDVTAVNDFLVCDSGRGIAIKGAGGQGMTRRLLELLEKQGFDERMCEALKRSSICEILPTDVPLPGEPGSHSERASNTAAAASTGAVESGAVPNGAAEADGSKIGTAPRGPGPGTEVGGEIQNGYDEEKEGVLDVASIVAKGNPSEILAKREKERLEKLAAKKSAGADTVKPVRLKNSEKATASFSYEDEVSVDDQAVVNGASDEGKDVRKRTRDVVVGPERFMAASPSSALASSEGILDTIATTIHKTILSVPDMATRSNLWENLIILGNGSRVRGFTPALLAVLMRRYAVSPSTATIFTSELPSNLSTPIPTGGTNTPIPGIPTHPMHHPAGHGVNPLLVAATHANQSQNQQQQQQQSQYHPPGGPSSSTSLHVPSIATDQAASSPNLQPGPPHPHLHQQVHNQHHHRGHNQTPTTIKLVKPPEYFPEWKDSAGGPGSSSGSNPNPNTKPVVNNPSNGVDGVGGGAGAGKGTGTGVGVGVGVVGGGGGSGTGMEEAVFLGAQVAAKVVFIVDQGLSKGFLTRADYNEMGPAGIHECAM